MPIQKVGVAGCGQMGSGIAEVLAKGGCETLVYEVNQELLDRGLGRIRSSLDRAVNSQKLERAAADTAFGRVRGTLDLQEFRDRDFVVEAIVENIDEKKKLWAALDPICQPETIFATNTSSLIVIEQAAVTKRATRFVGFHFFIPAPVMPLVEVVRTVVSDEAVVQEVFEFARRIGKTPILAKDETGFVVNRLLVPYLMLAIRAYESGLASREDIDTGMKLGAGHPMGPLTLSDFIGLDTMYHVGNIMFDEFKDPVYAPPPLLKRLVLAGHLGRKTGQGFYDYTQPK